MKAGDDFEVVNPENDPRYRDFWQTYPGLTERKGMTESFAKLEMRHHNSLIGSVIIIKVMTDGIVCGTVGNSATHLEYADEVVGREAGANVYSVMSGVIVPGC